MTACCRVQRRAIAVHRQPLGRHRRRGHRRQGRIRQRRNGDDRGCHRRGLDEHRTVPPLRFDPATLGELHIDGESISRRNRAGRSRSSYQRLATDSAASSGKPGRPSGSTEFARPVKPSAARSHHLPIHAVSGLGHPRAAISSSSATVTVPRLAWRLPAGPQRWSLGAPMQSTRPRDVPPAAHPNTR